MIIRSVAAADIDGLILPKKGCAKLDALVIKASAGALFRCPIYRCDTLDSALSKALKQSFSAIAMDLQAKDDLKSVTKRGKQIFVLGNESEGLSSDIRALCNERVKIPMANGVESLNVAVTASLIAFSL
jgi:23S rRNA (guanosine2251-2'-O)-methyltransferase